MVEAFSNLIPYYSWLYIPVALVALLSALRYRRLSGFFCSGMDKAISIIFGILFVFFYTFGLVISSGAFITWKSMCFILVSCCLFSPAIGIGYHCISRFFEKQFNVNDDSVCLLYRHPILLPSIIMLVCWTPVFLALYPGLFAYDVAVQIPQGAGRYSTWQPLLHTLYLKAFYNLGEIIGSYNTGMALSVVAQMVLFALSLSYLVRYMVLRHVRKQITITVLVFFSAVPICPIMAVSMTKDTLFTAAFLASFIKILEIKDSGFSKLRIMDWTAIFILLVLTGLLRSNGKYAVYAVAAAFFIESLIVRASVKQAYVLSVTAIVLVSVSNAVLVSITQAAPVSRNEMMSVPYQQLARVYRYAHESFSPEDAVAVKNLIPDISHYNIHNSDGVKMSAKVFDSVDNQKLFWRLYFKYMPQNMDKYVEAFFVNTIGYWYLDDISNSQMYGKRGDGTIADDFGLFLMDTKSGFGVTHESKLQWLDDVIKKLFHENKYQEIPVVATLFSMGAYFWLLILLVCYCVQSINSKAIVPLVFVLSYMATVFAGPCALFRYALPYIVCIPAIMVMTYKKHTIKPTDF